jgi:hypothetical protein
MKPITLPVAELLGFAVSRELFGAGVALYFADRLAGRTRRITGLILASVALASTAAFAYDVLAHRSHS